nr:hypothetical protein CFP56_00884 [Quercus suber]
MQDKFPTSWLNFWPDTVVKGFLFVGGSSGLRKLGELTTVKKHFGVGPGYLLKPSIGLYATSPSANGGCELRNADEVCQRLEAFFRIRRDSKCVEKSTGIFSQQASNDNARIEVFWG